MTRLARRSLVVLLYFGAASAVGGGILGVAANGAGVPLAYLHGTVFTTYLVPSLVLGILVGGTQLIGAIMVHRHRPRGLAAAAVAGFGMIIWIFVELTIIGFDWLQVVYFALGIVEISLVLILLGALTAPSVAA